MSIPKCSVVSRFLALVALAACSSAQTPQPKPISLCDVLAQLPSLKTKEVAVRGMWFATDEGQWLVPPEPKCPRDLVTEGFVWNNSIHLVEAKPPFYHEDSRAELDLDKKLRVAHDEPERYFVVVTVIGTLETRVPPLVVRSPDGMVTGYGFGHLNISPAELTYKRVAEAVLVDEKAQNKPGVPKTP